MITSSYFKDPLEAVRGRDLQGHSRLRPPRSFEAETSEVVRGHDLNLTSEAVWGRDLKSNVQVHLRLFIGHSPGSDLQEGPSGGGGGERSDRWGGVAERSDSPAGRPYYIEE